MPRQGLLAALESSSVAMVAVRPNWSFSAQGPVCSYQGINVRFESQKNLANSRQICEQFFHEVMTLTDELAWQQRHGVAIEWEDLDIQATPHRSEHMVALNAIGDAVLVAVPLLYRSPDLLQQVLPWIRQRLNNQQELSIDIDADRYWLAEALARALLQLLNFMTALSNWRQVICPISLPFSTTGRRRLLFMSISWATSTMSSLG